jgi:NTP pyrophosphatase (non-canonical NTP hydrolase)
VFAQYPGKDDAFVYPALGLTGEAGEVADKVKKQIRNLGVHTPSAMSAEDKADLAKELGDVLWYVAQLATELGVDLDDIANNNLTKLQDRMDRNVIASTGDAR